MSDQHTFAGLAWAGKKKQTRREQFLAEMDRVVPWREMLRVIAPHYPAPCAAGRPSRSSACVSFRPWSCA